MYSPDTGRYIYERKYPMQKNSQYDDIIDLPHHVSPNRPHMSALERAAQFAPFAALSGYGDAVNETARLTDRRLELDEYAKEELNQQLQIIANYAKDSTKVLITYFRPDTKKAGGEYVTLTGCVKKIDEYERTVLMQSGEKISIDEIISLDGDLFRGIQT